MDRLQANEPLALHHPRDIEGVHQMRVATRGMRSCLQIYRPLIPKTVSAAIGDGIRAVTDALGPARDWDVFIEDETEDGGAGVDGAVAEHEETVVNWDGYEVENYREDNLDYGDNEAPVDDKLTG